MHKNNVIHKTGLCSCPDWKINGSLLKWEFRYYNCLRYCFTFIVDYQMCDQFSLSIEENDRPQTFSFNELTKKFSVLSKFNFRT